VSYLTKDIDFETLPQALLEVAEGKAAIPLRSSLAWSCNSIPATRASARPRSAPNSDRASRAESGTYSPVLAEGLSTRDIAKRLQLKPSGVRAHISAVVQKLGVADRREAVAFFTKPRTADPPPNRAQSAAKHKRPGAS